MISSLNKETRGFSVVDPSRVCSNRRSGEDKCSSSLELLQNQEERMRRDSYVIDVDHGKNCYSCGGFGHLARNCRNKERIEQEKRLEYRRN